MKVNKEPLSMLKVNSFDNNKVSCHGNSDDILNQGGLQSKPTHDVLCKLSCVDDWFIVVYCSEFKNYDTKTSK